MTPGDEQALTSYFRGDGSRSLPSNYGNVVRRLELGCRIDSSGDPWAEEEALAESIDQGRASSRVHLRLREAGRPAARVLELVYGTDAPSTAPHASARWGKLAALALALTSNPAALESACLRLATQGGSGQATDVGHVLAAGKAAVEAHRAAEAAWLATGKVAA